MLYFDRKVAPSKKEYPFSRLSERAWVLSPVSSRGPLLATERGPPAVRSARARAPAVGAACADCGSFGGVRGPRAAHRVAGAVAERPPRTRHVRASLGSILHHIDLTY